MTMLSLTSSSATSSTRRLSSAPAPVCPMPVGAATTLSRRVVSTAVPASAIAARDGPSCASTSAVTRSTVAATVVSSTTAESFDATHREVFDRHESALRHDEAFGRRRDDDRSDALAADAQRHGAVDADRLAKRVQPDREAHGAAARSDDLVDGGLDRELAARVRHRGHARGALAAAFVTACPAAAAGRRPLGAAVCDAGRGEDAEPHVVVMDAERRRVGEQRVASHDVARGVRSPRRHDPVIAGAERPACRREPHDQPVLEHDAVGRDGWHRDGAGRGGLVEVDHGAAGRVLDHADLVPAANAEVTLFGLVDRELQVGGQRRARERDRALRVVDLDAAQFAGLSAQLAVVVDDLDPVAVVEAEHVVLAE